MYKEKYSQPTRNGRSMFSIQLEPPFSKAVLPSQVKWVSETNDGGLYISTGHNLYRGSLKTVHTPKLLELPELMKPGPTNHQAYKYFDVFCTPGKPIVVVHYTSHGFEILAISKELAHDHPRLKVEEESLYFVTAQDQLVKVVLGILHKPRELSKALQSGSPPRVLNKVEVLAERILAFTCLHPYPLVVLYPDGTIKAFSADNYQVRLDILQGSDWLSITRTTSTPTSILAVYTKGVYLLGGDLVPRDHWQLPEHSGEFQINPENPSQGHVIKPDVSADQSAPPQHPIQDQAKATHPNKQIPSTPPSLNHLDSDPKLPTAQTKPNPSQTASKHKTASPPDSIDNRSVEHPPAASLTEQQPKPSLSQVPQAENLARSLSGDTTIVSSTVAAVPKGLYTLLVDDTHGLRLLVASGFALRDRGLLLAPVHSAPFGRRSLAPVPELHGCVGVRAVADGVVCLWATGGHIELRELKL